MDNDAETNVLAGKIRGALLGATQQVAKSFTLLTTHTFGTHAGNG